MTGPYRDYLATDLITFHMSGYAPGILGGVTDPATEPPLRAGGHQAEFVTGLTAATATLMALALRRKSNKGTHVDVSAQEAMIMMAQGAVSNAAFGRGPRSRRRSDNRPGALVAVLPTSDGYVAISPREEHQWAAWLQLLGDPPWGDDERFSTPQLRLQNWPALEPLLIAWTSRHAKEDVYRSAQAAHVPAFPVNTAADLFQSPQLQSRGFLHELDHPVVGRLPYAGFPYALSNAQLELSRPAPTLGQHNGEVLGDDQHQASATHRRRRTSISSGSIEPAQETALPLAGVRVVDFSWVIAGPTCTRILANMGAEVIKVESRHRPDPTRRGEGANFHYLNQSKRSLSLNLRSPQGLALAKQLIAVSDVAIENFATGVFERLGLGYEELEPLRPDLIMVSSSGLGHTGPDRDHVAYGTLIQCFTGWSSLTGNADGPPLPGGVWTDPVTGMLQALLIVSALHNRQQTGLGQYVDFAMAEVICTMLPEALMDYAMNQRIQGPLGNADPLFEPHGLYACRGEDRWVAIAVTSDEQWRHLCHAIERSELADDARFASLDGRKANALTLHEIISAWTRNLPVTEAVKRLQAQGVPAGPSMTGVDVFNDPHLAARGFFTTHTSNAGDQLRLPGLPWQFRPGPRPRVAPAPALGQHNSAVLGDLLGLSPQEIQRLIDEQVVY
jgi:crotonobetainyl-CoA:carnitine CoA-transferase CaiB-like acyl-CoA transferase